MRDRLLHTPEGVRDIYNEECERKLALEERLNRLLRQYGYHPIQTPTFEFFDIFGREIGTTPSRDLYKFFDKEGNTLVLRPDITPSVARCAAKYFGEEDMPLRLCYMGNTFINNSRYQGRLKECTQLGAEFIGAPGADADAEILAMAAACLRAAGLKDFRISVGHADFFRGLLEAAGLKEEQEEELRDLIANRNFFGVEEFVESLNLEEGVRRLFGMLGDVYEGADGLLEAERHAAGYPRILAAIGRLRELYGLLEVYGISRHVSFELGLINDYRYYTGMIFAAYTFGSGEAIVRGGRYDGLLGYFGDVSDGKAASAGKSASCGFAVVIDQLLAVLSRQKIEVPVEHRTKLIVYRAERRDEAVRLAEEERRQGGFVELLACGEGRTREDCEAYAARNHVARVVFL